MAIELLYKDGASNVVNVKALGRLGNSTHGLEKSVLKDIVAFGKYRRAR